jgi:hypothetical protein
LATIIIPDYKHACYFPKLEQTPFIGSLSEGTTVPWYTKCLIAGQKTLGTRYILMIRITKTTPPRYRRNLASKMDAPIM